MFMILDSGSELLVNPSGTLVSYEELEPAIVFAEIVDQSNQYSCSSTHIASSTPPVTSYEWVSLVLDIVNAASDQNVMLN